MSAEVLEEFLARIYTDRGCRARFLRCPRAVASAHGLSPEEIQAVVRLDREGLELACESFARRRGLNGVWIDRFCEVLRRHSGRTGQRLLRVLRCLKLRARASPGPS